MQIVQFKNKKVDKVDKFKAMNTKSERLYMYTIYKKSL